MAIVRPTPYYGTAHPCSMYRNGVKLAGYKELPLTGTDMAFARTYNDRVDLVVLGRSKQTVTVQGKNLFDMDRFARSSHYSNYYSYNALTGLMLTAPDYISWASIPVFVALQPNTQYKLSVSNACYLEVGDGAAKLAGGSNLRSLTFTTGTNGLVSFKFAASAPAGFIIGNVQVELGTTATPYEPFAPNSPSPDYPSPVISSAGSIRVQDQAGLRYADVGLPTLRAIPDGGGGWIARDSVETAGGRLIHRRQVDPAIDEHTTAPIIGATEYILASPVVTDIGAALESYYPYTRILVSGDNMPEVTARCKVVDA